MGFIGDIFAVAISGIILFVSLILLWTGLRAFFNPTRLQDKVFANYYVLKLIGLVLMTLSSFMIYRVVAHFISWLG